MSCGEKALLIDAGLSGVEVERRMAKKELSVENLAGIVITHEHSDHVRGAGILCRRYNLPLYISQTTFQACSGLGKVSDIRFFECGRPFSVGKIRVSPFSTSHDACDSAGLTIEYAERKIGIATDLGVATNLVKSHLMNSNVLYLESNHDPDMLMAGPYPWHLKQRIKGRTGHLSNFDAASLVGELLSDSLQHVILAHLSEENNCPSAALQVMKEKVNGSPIQVSVARPHEPGDVIAL